MGSTMDDHQRSIESSLWESACWKLETEMRSDACKELRPSGQNAVIGLMIFSAAFGFVAAILAICGVCTSPLPKKIYYFHSAGEIFFVCGWQNAVKGLMIFSAAFGFVAAILAICGVCTSPLPKKMYYFHSAGEIFFVCEIEPQSKLQENLK